MGFLSRFFGPKEKAAVQPEKNEIQECTCLFCGQTFKPEEIVFGSRSLQKDPAYRDNVFMEKLQEYMGATEKIEVPFRRLFSQAQYTVDSYEEGTKLPLSVKADTAMNDPGNSKNGGQESNDLFSFHDSSEDTQVVE